MAFDTEQKKEAIRLFKIGASPQFDLKIALLKFRYFMIKAAIERAKKILAAYFYIKNYKK